MLATGIGHQLARQSDERLASEQHAALRRVVAEFQPSVLMAAGVGPRLMRAVEQVAGVKNIKFTSAPDKADQEIQPVVTPDGRIVGFFVWDSTRPMTHALNGLAPFAAVMAFVLMGLAALSLLHLKRARREMALREAEAARAADEDKLTALPNHAKTLELLDQALAERADHDCTTFALIELDGMG